MTSSIMSTLKLRLKRWPLAAALNAALKAQAMERNAAAIRRKYERALQRGELVVPQGSALRVALRSRVGERALRRGWPKGCGDLHLFLMYSERNWEAVLPKALATFGRVTSFEWRSLGFEEGATDWAIRREEMNRQLLAAFRAAGAKRPVDVVVGYVSGATIAPEILLAMAREGAAITNFCFDDKVHWPGHRIGGRYTSPAAIAHVVDLNLTSDPQGMARYAERGGLAMFHPEAADPEVYQPLDLPFEYDVSFIGSRFGWRPSFIAQLERKGIRVTCFGEGWHNGAIGTEDMKLVYAKSRVNLGFGGIGHSRKLVCLKGRDFEVPMSGALYLTQHNPELALVFDIGREVLTYRDVDDCARIIQEVLADQTRAAEIRRAARARSMREHTYFARWRRVLETLGALAGEPHDVGIGLGATLSESGPI
jgi:spore maturation protein CgeB